MISFDSGATWRNFAQLPLSSQRIISLAGEANKVPSVIATAADGMKTRYITRVDEMIALLTAKVVDSIVAFPLAAL